MKKAKYTLERIDEYITEYKIKGILKYRHFKDSDGDEWWYEYDENGNEIHTKDSNGDEWWIEYDENGNKIHTKNSEGHEWWREYDENNNLIHIHTKNSDGYEWSKNNPKNKEPEYKEPFTF